MPDTWLTIEQAAVELRLSVRTVNRHINARKIQFRLHEGRREVLVRLADGQQNSEDSPVSVQPHGSSDTGEQRVTANSPLSAKHAELSFAGERATSMSDIPPKDGGTRHQNRFVDNDDLSPQRSTSETQGSHSATRSTARVVSSTGEPRRETPPFTRSSHSFAAESFGQATTPSDQDEILSESEEAPDNQSQSTAMVGPASSVDVETVLTLADQAADKADVAIVAYQTLARLADTQVRTLRRNGRIAWGFAGLLTVGVMAGGWWATQRITSNEKEIHQLRLDADYQKNMASMSASQLERVAVERDSLGQQASKAREDAALAREQQAKLEGRVAAMSEANKRSEARLGIFGRISSFFDGRP